MSRCLAVLLTLAVLVPTALASTRSGVYKGKVAHGSREMDISLQLLSGGTRARWQVDVSGPCAEAGRGFGWSFGTTERGYRLLQIRAGRFAIDRKRSMGHYSYRFVLIGHAVRNGFAGTLHYTESDFPPSPTTCDSTVLHWHATPSDKPFP